MNNENQERNYLVTGASGYVGGRLVRDLLDDKKKVRVLVRDAKKILGQSWSSQVEIIEGNASNAEDLDRALAGIHTAYYLLHSINVSTDFGDIESAMAKGAKAFSEQLLAGATPTHENAFKLTLVERTLASVMAQARAQA